MFIMMSNTYRVNENRKVRHVATGLVGAFRDRDCLLNVWNRALKEFGAPEDAIQDYQPSESTGNTRFLLDDDCKFIEELGKAKWVIEMMSKETEMNQVLMK